jgi:C-terminal processing protease CtpA/Prc
VRITTSYYYTPKGRLIHEIGITPDKEVTEDPKSGHDRALETALDWIRGLP